jgi:hypothetical protein
MFWEDMFWEDMGLRDIGLRLQKLPGVASLQLFYRSAR